MKPAYACRITKENMGAIASEMPGFDLVQALAWLREHRSGYFIRDENSKVFDCRFMSDPVFHATYVFEYGDDTQLFRRIIMTKS